MRHLFLIPVVVALFFLTGCGEIPLHHNLTEMEADKILVLLDENGISASKKKETEGQDVSWTVVVSGGEIVIARKLLVENNLPTRKELGLSGVYQEKGLIPTPDEQRARFLLALKGELVNALRTIPGVHEVGVILNIPAEKELFADPDKKARPSASVTLRIANPEMLKTELTEEKIRRFVANAIPDMSPNDVIVILSAGEGGAPLAAITPSSAKNGKATGDVPPEVGGTAGEGVPMIEVAGIRLEEDSLKRFKVYLLVFLCVLILLSAALLVTLFRMGRLRRRSGNRRLKAVPVEGGEGGPDLLTGGGHPGG